MDINQYLQNNQGLDSNSSQFLMDQESGEARQNFGNGNQNQRFDDDKLVELHKIYGNKWKIISAHFQHRNDCFIKNHFYSLLRKALRKVNCYIKMLNVAQNNKFKLLKLNFVFKITNLAQSERNGYSIKNTYTNLLYKFVQLKNQTLQRINTSGNVIDTKFFSGAQNQQIEELIKSFREIQHFFIEHNLNKKGKSKKKCPKKLQLKKDIIQRSIKQKMENQDQKRMDPQTPLLTTMVSGSTTQQEHQLIYLDLDGAVQEAFFSLVNAENWFDPILFN